MTIQKVSNVALFVDVRRKAAVNAAKVVADMAEQRGVALQIVESQAQALGLNGARVSHQFPALADVLVSLGGDGTLLHAAHLAGPLGIPLIGVGFGRVGFLTEVPRDGYEGAFNRLLQGGIKTEPHLALEARIVGTPQVFYAVNDVHVDRKHHGHIVNFGIYLEDERIATIPADGIVVSSPTGSTAYFLSAGGPILSPTLDAIGIAPICPHTLFSRPLVVGANEKIRIVLPESAESLGTELFVDGHPEVELSPGAMIEVVKAPRPIEFVRLHDRFFFQTLEDKLHWGASIKRSLDDDPS